MKNQAVWLVVGVALLALGFLAGRTGSVSGEAMGRRVDLAEMSQDITKIDAPIEYDLGTDNYVGTHNFQVKIEGIDVINTEFQSITGVVSESEAVELEQTVGSYVRTTGGQVYYEPVTLERVYKGVDDFYGWRLEVENGNIERRDVTITMMDSAFRPIRAMTLDEAWPSKWEMPDMDASSSGPAIERITLMVERVRESAP